MGPELLVVGDPVIDILGVQGIGEVIAVPDVVHSRWETYFVTVRWENGTEELCPRPWLARK